MTTKGSFSQVQSDVNARTKEDRHIEKMLQKTGKDIYKLRKTKTASKGQLDVHAFKEKMAFFTNLKNDVPTMEAATDEEEDTGSECSTLKNDPVPKTASKAAAFATSVPVTSSFSSETVNTLTEDETGGNGERFSYEIDPEIGVIV